MKHTCGNCIHYRGDNNEGFCYLNGGALTYFECEACTAYNKEETNE